MKIVFFGTPDYVIPILESLHKSFRQKDRTTSVKAVVTQKPKPSGRRKMLAYSAVDKWAHKKKVPVIYTGKDVLKKKVTADIGILAAFGEILPKSVINSFPYGILNIHPSLLPKYRGASPVQAAILMGEKQTGVTFTKMDEQLDKGKKVTQYKKDIFDNDTTDTLRTRLFNSAAEVLTTLVPAYMKGKIKTEDLGHEKGTFTAQITKEQGYILPKYINNAIQGKTTKSEWKISFIKNASLVPNAASIERFTRAMQPWPQAWTYVRTNSKDNRRETKRLKILKTHVGTSKKDSTKLYLDLVQLEGKNPVSWEQFINGYPEFVFGD